MKSNSYGSGHFFTLDTEQVISREQWKPLPMDVGTINLLNSIAKKGPLLPKNLRLIFKSAEVHGEEAIESDMYAPDEPERIGGDTGNMPDPIDVRQDEPSEEDQ
jgi:hypothetical protein